MILRLFLNGGGIRDTARVAGVSINTVTALLLRVGRACEFYHDHLVRKLTCKRIQVDEIWSFIYAKQDRLKTVVQPKRGMGDVWLWVGFCPDSKLVVNWRLGDRTTDTAIPFMADLASRVEGRIQLTSDGHKPYIEAVEKAFGRDVDFARRISFKTDDGLPNVVVDIMSGSPTSSKIGTSLVERMNGSIRHFNGRYTRSTYSFSKKDINHALFVAISMMGYNFCWEHRTLRVTPAMEAGLAKHIWEVSELLELTAKFEKLVAA